MGPYLKSFLVSGPKADKREDSCLSKARHFSDLQVTHNLGNLSTGKPQAELEFQQDYRTKEA